MTTIKHILDNHTSREAAAIFGDIIKANTQDFPDWDHIFDAARASDIVNSVHPKSKAWRYGYPILRSSPNKNALT